MADKNFITITSPYDGDEVGKVRDLTNDEIKASLNRCLYNGKKVIRDYRLDILKKLHLRIKHDKKDISKLISQESGLCLKDTTHEVDRTLDLLNCAKTYLDFYDPVCTSNFAKNKEKPFLTVKKHPLSLICAITPFNHPLNQVAHKIIPNIIADSNIILKPSEKTPLTAIYFFRILHEVGLPMDQYRIITSKNPANTLKLMIKTKGIEALTFTGGIKAGLSISKSVANSSNPFIRQIYELGGNSAVYISQKADIKKAAQICLGAFSNSGQRCTSIKRILLNNEIAADFINKFLNLTGKLRYGDPLNPATDVGTVINENSAIEIQKRVDAALLDRAKLLIGNKRDGAVYSPTILDKVNPESKLVIEETFGPVAPIIRVKSIKEAISVVNSSKYALAGSIVSDSREEAYYYYNSINVGQFNWNNAPGFRFENAPFGGFGFSGNYQKEGLIMAADQYQKIRTFYEH